MNYIVTKNPTFFEAIGQYNYCTFEEMGEMLTKGIAVDTETTGLNAQDDKIFAVQIGTGKDNFLMDLQEYRDKKKQQGLGTVLPYLEGRHLVFHNGLFDLGFPGRIQSCTLKIAYVKSETRRLIWGILVAAIQNHRQHLVTVEQPIRQEQHVVFGIGEVTRAGDAEALSEAAFTLVCKRLVFPMHVENDNIRVL